METVDYNPAALCQRVAEMAPLQSGYRLTSQRIIAPFSRAPFISFKAALHMNNANPSDLSAAHTEHQSQACFKARPYMRIFTTSCFC